MNTVLKSEKFQNIDMDLPIAFGKTISNETYIVDLQKISHLLMRRLHWTRKICWFE